MATKKIELEVDFIGGEGALTAAEEKALSDFFKQRKKAKRLSSQKVRYLFGKKKSLLKPFFGLARHITSYCQSSPKRVKVFTPATYYLLASPAARELFYKYVPQRYVQKKRPLSIFI